MGKNICNHIQTLQRKKPFLNTIYCGKRLMENINRMQAGWKSKDLSILKSAPPLYAHCPHDEHTLCCKVATFMRVCVPRKCSFPTLEKRSPCHAHRRPSHRPPVSPNKWQSLLLLPYALQKYSFNYKYLFKSKYLLIQFYYNLY